jgi:hypothetical protein
VICIVLVLWIYAHLPCIPLYFMPHYGYSTKIINDTKARKGIGSKNVVFIVSFVGSIIMNTSFLLLLFHITFATLALVFLFVVAILLCTVK